MGGQKKRFKDHIKSSLSKYGIPYDRLEELAGDREEWRAVCDKGLATFEQQHIDVAVAKRARRHQQRNQPHPARGHMHRHKETRWAESSSNRRTTKRERHVSTMA